MCNLMNCFHSFLFISNYLGSLEALLEFLKQSQIPYSGINIGPVHKKDVMKASTMLEHSELYGVILGKRRSFEYRLMVVTEINFN